jgi:hypothetical protein
MPLVTDPEELAAAVIGAIDVVRSAEVQLPKATLAQLKMASNYCSTFLDGVAVVKLKTFLSENTGIEDALQAHDVDALKRIAVQFKTEPRTSASVGSALQSLVVIMAGFPTEKIEQILGELDSMWVA